ncbi:MAG: hypothetical protein LBH19_08010 [Dysgonamonadaceae bacterium]|jgi:hypothetical protein|nr:hypothetical protein [Dysgonamonadaceae bacterium]
MKKYLFLLVLAFMTNAVVQAQKNLEAELLPDKIAFNGEGKYAIIVLLVDNAFDLEFSTSLDGPKGSLILDHEIVSKGAQIEHTLTFDATDKNTRGAILIIKCAKYNDLKIPIYLAVNQALKYFVDDPRYWGNKPCPVMHSILGDTLFFSFSYERAKAEYNQALSCWEEKYKEKVNKTYLESQINTIDKITKLAMEAEQEEERVIISEGYKSLYEKYNAIYELNPFDEKIRKKRDETFRIYSDKCKEYTQKADSLFKHSESDSEEYYKKIINLSCGNTADAQIRINELNKRIMRDSRHVLAYEYEKDASIGLSSGNYNNNYLDPSGYFSLRFNPKLFDLTRLEDSDSLRAEANISFGWTFKLLRLGDFLKQNKGWDNSGLWLFFGPGATAICDVKPKNSIASEGEESTSENSSRIGMHYALSPEAGVLFKLAIPKYGSNSRRSGFGLVFRYTYQYRYAIKKEDVDLFGKSKNVIGFGFCF